MTSAKAVKHSRLLSLLLAVITALTLLSGSIAMTADAFAEDIQRAVQSGMNDHIAKPIDLKEVLRVLQKYLCAQHMAV